jgi:hypothetical protein
MRPSPILPVALALILFALSPFSSHAQEPNPVPTHFRTIYPPPSQAHAQVEQAMHLAAQQHKRILLDFGNNRNPDCQVLAGYLQQQPNEAQIAEHFLLVNINLGPNLKQNLDLAQRFGADPGKGIPAVSVIDGSGHIIHPASHADFAGARYMGLPDVTAFLNKWRE